MLSDIPIAGKSRIEVVPGQYFVQLDERPYLTLVFSFTLDHAGAQMQHPKFLARFPIVLEFKHSSQSGSKFWSQRPGVEVYVAVDKKNVRLVSEDGGSFPRINIGNARIRLNVSGGGNPWTDIIRERNTVCSNVGVRTMGEIARLAMTVEECKQAKIGICTPENRGFDVIANGLARADILHRLTPGKPIFLAEGYQHHGANCLKFVKRLSSQQVACGETAPEVGVALSQIDWVKTATAGGFSVRTPGSLQYNNLQNV